MKSIFLNKWIKLVAAILVMVCSASCLGDDNRTITLSKGEPNALPEFDEGDGNTNIPNINYTVDDKKDDIVIDMTGIQDPDSDDEWLKLIGSKDPDQNIWITIDTKVIRIIVKNNADDTDASKNVKNDFIFLVDNSGSMGDEANAIAKEISSWAENLSSKLDVQFGCVGYDGLIRGAINLTSYDKLSAYLNRSGKIGINRTIGFDGPDAEYLESSKSSYDLSKAQDECPMAALKYADALFSFREGANRIYVNFTDEPNYPSNKEEFSVHFLASQSNWKASQGTIHTVYSATDISSETTNQKEKSCRMSEYTGGTTLYVKNDFSDASLESLPITGAMQNSYTIRCKDVKEFIDGYEHTLTITIMTKDGRVKAKKSFTVTFPTK